MLAVNEEKTEEQKLLSEKIHSGELPLAINMEKQQRHILPEGAASMPDGISYITVGLEKCQRIVDRYSGTGDVVHVPSSNKFKEFIETDTYIGVDGSL